MKLIEGTQVIKNYVLDESEMFLTFQMKEPIMELRCMLVYPMGKGCMRSLMTSCTQEQLQPIMTFPLFTIL